MTGWRTTTLGQAVTIERTPVLPQDIATGTTYVGLEHIERGGSFANVGTVEADELASTKFRFTAKHLLYGKLRPYLAKIARPSFNGVCSTDILPILPGPEVDRSFLLHFLRRPESVEFASSRAVGANLPRLSPSVLAAMTMPLPPLGEQQRIGRTLDVADALRAKRRAALAQLDTLTQAIFIQMFGDPVTNPRGWSRKPVGELGTVITGNTPPRAVSAYYGPGIEWIKSDNLNTPEYYLTRAEETLSLAGRQVARVAPAGAVLVTCIAGSPECIGNAGMADREVAFNQQINAFVPNKVDSHFFYAHLRVGKGLVQAASTSGMKGMVSKGRFEQIRLIVPPIELQRQFGQRAVAVETLRGKLRASLAEMDDLFASLQHRAFRGEL
jgi:type I restriction enzyme S subunit